MRSWECVSRDGSALVLLACKLCHCKLCTSLSSLNLSNINIKQDSCVSKTTDLGTKHFDGSSILKVFDACHCFTFVKADPELRCVQKWKKSCDNILHFSVWTTHLIVKHNRIRTGVNKLKMTAEDDSKVQNDHHEDGRGICAGKNIRSSDSGGIETIDGPNGVTPTVHRHAPLHVTDTC